MFQFRGNRYSWFPTKSFLALTTGYFSVNICNAIKCAFIQHLHHSCNQTRFHSFPQKSRLFILSNEILGPKLFTCLVVMGGLVVDTCIVSSIIKFLTFFVVKLYCCLNRPKISKKRLSTVHYKKGLKLTFDHKSALGAILIAAKISWEFSKCHNTVAAAAPIRRGLFRRYYEASTFWNKNEFSSLAYN